MNLLTCFEAYEIDSIHLKYSKDNGVSWLPIVTSSLLNDEAWEHTNDAICDFLQTQDLESTSFLVGILTPDYDCDLIRMEGEQTRSLNIAECMPSQTPEPA